MLRALYTSATGMKAQELMIDNTANNLANVNTTGFRKSHLDFADLVYNTMRQPGTAVTNQQVSPTGLQIGNGVRAVSTTKHFTQGALEQTGNSLDVSIEGDGFFQLLHPNGEFRYSRAGNFKVDANSGNLVNPDGLVLNPAITITQGTDISKISIGSDGSVEGVSSNSSGTPVSLGQIQVVTFLNAAGLSSEGSNLFAETPASGAAVVGNPSDAGFGLLRQGYLENSNVEVVTELISLISAQRAYEINSRAIRAGDEMLSTSADIVR
ncbi:flagellar basal-body rod protein FlgG [Fuerstiella marisgermanici]|uniref:Flagellar basal-body rod protein FlgG n=1 Tax=Fuerstiella marisgermanici TaxID=1891926 RepID=A0A1P8WA54_9PLAN|nr:flagellar basal-body rod protein FlgG [Fuerstiella marisgermanici]APZ90937.1 Distal rod protein [Fuerstiella marisgermanici]